MNLPAIFPEIREYYDQSLTGIHQSFIGAQDWKGRCETDAGLAGLDKLLVIGDLR